MVSDETRLRGTAAGNLGQAIDLAHCLGLERGHRHADPLQHRRNDALGVFDQRSQNVYRLHLRIAVLAGEIVRPLHGLLSLDG